MSKTALTIDEVLALRRLRGDGKPKSGRVWKLPRARTSSINKRSELVAGSLKERQERRAELKRRRETLTTLREERERERDRIKKQKEAQRQHREMMALQGASVQVVSKPSKLKKLTKKQRRQYVTQAQLLQRLGRE